MKATKLVILSALFTLVACGEAKGIDYKSIDLNEAGKTVQNMGELGEFELVSPMNNAIVEEIDTFTWGECENAEAYAIEISSSDQFQSDLDTVDYYRKDNIVGTSFTINSAFEFKDQNYYWRVFAKNSKGNKQSTSTFSFFIKAPSVDEVKLDVGEADDWNLHPLGSYADISIDNSNFFGNDEDSLKISFKKEYTSRGNEESDGWIIVTKSVEKNIYGTDALFFNCFYAGQDATVVIRLIDRDNEYWFCQVQLSYNAKQSIFLKFSDFEQRFQDVTVGNEVFDFERIKYMEVVFERTFGDGVLLISNVKAVKFEDYKEWFIDKLNFNDYEDSQFINDNYEFEREIIEDYEMRMAYYGSNAMGKPLINGYGFVKIAVNRFMFTGDCVKVSVKYTGAKGSNVVLRIYEEDTDRWSYKIPFSTLTAGVYTTLVIPYAAFAKSQVTGDGKRQFYYIFNIQFGLEGVYSAGNLFFKDFEVVKRADYITEPERIVNSDGMIEDFDNYQQVADMYRIWTVSDTNKDEYISLNSTVQLGSENKSCGQLYYKADMGQAQYYIPVKVSDDFTSISVWLKDASIKPIDTRVNHIDAVNADVTLYFRVSTGEIYKYDIPKLEKIWNQYDIPFTDFVQEGNPNKKAETTAQAITHVGIAMQYFYYDADNRPMPLYTDDSPVYMDNFLFSHREAFNKSVKEKVIALKDGVAMIDDMEDYQTNEDMEYFWNNGNTYDYQKMDVSDNVAANGGNRSLSLQYRINAASPSYYVAPTFDPDVKAKAFKISIASENQATVYVNIYTLVGTTTTQYRATISKVNAEWTEYIIGFNNLAIQSGGSVPLNSNFIPYISKVSIGVVYNDSSSSGESYIYIDNFGFDGTQNSYSINSRTVIEGEGE